MTGENNYKGPSWYNILYLRIICLFTSHDPIDLPDPQHHFRYNWFCVRCFKFKRKKII